MRERVRVNEHTISFWEVNRSKPSREHLVGLASCCEGTTDWLLVRQSAEAEVLGEAEVSFRAEIDGLQVEDWESIPGFVRHRRREENRRAAAFGGPLMEAVAHWAGAYYYEREAEDSARGLLLNMDDPNQAGLRRAYGELKQVVESFRRDVDERAKKTLRDIEVIRTGEDANLWREAVADSDNRFQESKPQLSRK